MTAPTYAALRQALFTKLDADLSVDVWSPKAPQDDDGELLAPFPYVVIVQANESPWNTKGSRGLDALVQIDAYARTTATDSAENLIAGLTSDVREALERQPLTVTGAHWVTTELESIIPGWEDNGKTRRAVMLFRVILDEGRAIALTSDDGTEMLVSDENEALAATRQTIDTVEALWS